MTLRVASDGYLGGSPLSVATSGYLGGLASTGDIIYYGGGGGAAGATWKAWDDEGFDTDTIHRKNAQIINLVAAIAASGILTCH